MSSIKTHYWRTNLRYLAILLVIWFVASYGAGIVLADWLNQFTIGGFPLGFWFAQQGAIYVFLILIAVYIVLMNNLDRRYREKHERQDA
jgi:putative solute:sodium symporter small subunit